MNTKRNKIIEISCLIISGFSYLLGLLFCMLVIELTDKADGFFSMISFMLAAPCIALVCGIALGFYGKKAIYFYPPIAYAVNVLAILIYMRDLSETGYHALIFIYVIPLMYLGILFGRLYKRRKTV